MINPLIGLVSWNGGSWRQDFLVSTVVICFIATLYTITTLYPALYRYCVQEEYEQMPDEEDTECSKKGMKIKGCKSR